MSADSESCELLRAVMRSADGEQICRLAVMVRDWDSLLGLGREHRVLSILFSRLADMGPEVPLTVQQQLRAEYERNIFHNLSNAAELIAVLKAFDHEMIPAMPFKGVVLGTSVYGDLTARPAGDLDVLIYYKHLQQATTALLERGYELKTPVRADRTPVDPKTYYEYHFERETDGRVLELSWRFEFALPKFKHDLGMDWVWPRRRTAMLAGAEVPDMSAEIKLLVLCMHGSKHVWSRLIWIYDVARLLDSTPELDWNDVIREAKVSGLGRALALGVLLAHRVAGAAVPEAVVRRFEADTIANKLAEHIAKSLFDAPGSKPVGWMPYSVQLLDFGDRVRWLLSLNFLEPNERDRATMTLPKPLHALYYVIRPFRIFWDRSAR